MDMGNPTAGILTPMHSKLLRVLRETSEPRTGRHIAERADVAPSSAHRVLGDWAAAGLVSKTPFGNTTLFVLNTEHLAVAPLLTLVDLRGSLFARLAGEISSWAIRPKYAAVFGSVARGDGDIDSDVDLLIVADDPAPPKLDAWDEQLETLRQQVYIWTGNHLAISVIRPSALDLLQPRSRTTLAAVREEGVPVYGSPFGEVRPSHA